LLTVEINMVDTLVPAAANVPYVAAAQPTLGEAQLVAASPAVVVVPAPVAAPSPPLTPENLLVRIELIEKHLGMDIEAQANKVWAWIKAKI
jgi:hypothetical protein